MKQVVKLTESDLHNIIDNAVKRILKESIDFEEMEERVYEVSRPLKDSTAFSEAMEYIKQVNPELYMKLIQIEYNEAVQ
jgi:hemerythrin superfamily protein